MEANWTAIFEPFLTCNIKQTEKYKSTSHELRQATEIMEGYEIKLRPDSN